MIQNIRATLLSIHTQLLWLLLALFLLNLSDELSVYQPINYVPASRRRVKQTDFICRFVPQKSLPIEDLLPIEEPFTKVSIAFKRPPFLWSSALSFLRSVSLNDSISNHSSLQLQSKKRRIRFLFYQSTYQSTYHIIRIKIKWKKS